MNSSSENKSLKIYSQIHVILRYFCLQCNPRRKNRSRTNKILNLIKLEYKLNAIRSTETTTEPTHQQIDCATKLPKHINV